MVVTVVGMSSSGGICRLSGVASTVSTLASLGGMVQRGLNDERVVMDTCRVMALFVIVAVLMVGLTKVLALTYNFKTGSRKMVVATSGVCVQDAAPGCSQ